jgi:hypothetical protein
MNKFGAYLKTKQFRTNLLMAIGAVFVVVLIVFFSLGFYTRHGEGIPVPLLKGLSVEKAMSILNRALSTKLIRFMYLTRHPARLLSRTLTPALMLKKTGQFI